MAKKPAGLPDTYTPVSLPGTVTLNPLFYVLISRLVAVVQEQAAQIETLRVGLNETRANPTTVYPVIPGF